MKKVKISLLALGMLVATAPASQAAFVKAPATVTVSATAAVNNSLEVVSEATVEATAAAATKMQAAKKGFFAKLFNHAPKAAGGSRSQTVAAVLAFFLGGLGIHRFYLGYTWQGVVQLLTAGGLGIWALIDFVRILTGDLQPKDGSYE